MCVGWWGQRGHSDKAGTVIIGAGLGLDMTGGD